MIEGALKQSFIEAHRLGHGWAGSEHALLAVLRGPDDDVGRQVLEQLGVTAAVFEARLIDRHDRARPRPDLDADGSRAANPALHQLAGWASGFAYTLGDGEVRGREVLLAVTYCDSSFAGAMLRSLDVEPAAILAGLAEAGAALPPVPPPPSTVPAFTQHVELERRQVHDVVAILIDRHPPGSGPRWGFNYDGEDRGWVDAEDGIDLPKIVSDAASASQDGAG